MRPSQGRSAMVAGAVDRNRAPTHYQGMAGRTAPPRTTKTGGDMPTDDIRDFLEPRLTALMDDAIARGFNADAVVAVLIDLTDTITPSTGPEQDRPQP